MTQADATKQNGPGARPIADLASKAGRALVVERAWPRLVLALAIGLVFLALSATGAWLWAPRAVRIAGVVGFGLAALAPLASLAWLRWPGARAILARLDRDFGARHRPATSYADALANRGDDPTTQALWAAHHERLARAVRAINVAPPAPGVAKRDPYALKFAAALAAFAAFAAAGPEFYGRLAAAFDWRSDAAIAAASSRIDAWIDPPPWAGRPPILIDFKSPAPQAYDAPETSTLVVRGEPGVVETRVEGAIAPIEAKAGAAVAGERRFVIRGDGKATILRDGATAAALSIAVTPDGGPTIALLEPPRGNYVGTLTLRYKTGDRYGLNGVSAGFALANKAGAPPPRSLASAPSAPLQLPIAQNGAGEATATIDLSEHPWAGAKVTMTLSATSVSGKTGSSAPVEMTLPEKPFRNPLARALVEQRRDLILDPNHAPPRIEAALAGLMVAPDLFETPAPIYLGLRQARSDLGQARTDAQLLDVAALLWSIALQIENGDATQAERDLRAAEQALREALKRGASDEELRKLMQALREAANRYAQEMAKDAKPSDAERDAQSKDLDRMMDDLEKAARNGAREDAEAMLDEMQQMFDNLRGSKEAEDSPQDREMQRQLDELQKLLRDQQALRDDTFRRDRRERERARKNSAPDWMAPHGKNGAPNEDQPPSGKDQGENDFDPFQKPGDDSTDGEPLDQRQGSLRDRLEELQRKLKGFGAKPEKGFGEADEAMKEAERDLQGDSGKPGANGKSGKGAAVDAQGRALQALREGAQGLAKQMQGQGKGRGRTVVRRGRPGDQPGDDPLGRGRNGQRGMENGALRESPAAAERARRVMEELRRRLADPARPPDERDYLERLLKRD